MPGDQCGHPERIRDGHRDEARVERWRVNRHVEVLEKRVQPLPFGRRLRQECRERVVVHHHQEDEEHLHGGDHGDHVRNQLSVAFAVRIDGDGAEDAE